MYCKLSLYEHRLLKTLDGTTGLEAAVEKLRSRGHYCSTQNARLILAKAAQSGMVICNPLVADANEMGGMDNISVIIVQNSFYALTI
jgi:hypothetical protein